MHDSERLDHPRFGPVARQLGLIDEIQLQACLRIQEDVRTRGETPPPLGQLLLQRRWISTETASRILAECGDDVDATLVQHGSPAVVAGQRIGRYEVIEELGRGGMGVVYKARDSTLDRIVAVKVLPAVDDTLRQRFEREARAAAKLRHPGLVSIHEVGSHDGAPYLVMDWIDGQTLETIIAHGRLEQPQAVALLVQVCDTLQRVHEEGIVHRDLKPANLLVDTQQRVYIADFGVSRVIGATSHTATGQQIGTPRYMSPEQADPSSRRPVDRRADIYALGVILYRLMTGRCPFEADTISELVIAIMVRQPPDPRTLEPELSGDLTAICLKALAKVPARRYRTAEALGEDLRAFQDGRPVSVRPPGALDRLRSWIGQRKLLSAGLFFGAVVLPAALLTQWRWLASRRARQVDDRIAAAEQALADDRHDEAVQQLDRAAALAGSRRQEIEQRLRHVRVLRDRHLQRQASAGQRRRAAELAREAAALETELARVQARHDQISVLDNQLGALTTQRHAVIDGTRHDRLAVRRERSALRRRILESRNEAIARYARALDLDPDNGEARRRLLAMYWERFRFNELGRRDETGYYRRLLEVLDRDGAYAERLKGDGALTLTTTPPSQLTLHRYRIDPESRRWVYGDRPPVRRGPTGGARWPLPIGDYMAVCHADGHAPLLFPFHVSRGAEVKAALTLRPPEQIPAGFALVTRGPTWITRGRSASTVLPLERDVLVAEKETTFAQYLAFLDGLAQEAPGQQERHLPRAGNGQPLVVRDKATGRMALRGGPMIAPDLPVHSITWFDAAAYCGWHNRRSGATRRVARILREAAWEAGPVETFAQYPAGWEAVLKPTPYRGQPLPREAWRPGGLALPAARARVRLRAPVRTGRDLAVELDVTAASAGGVVGLWFHVLPERSDPGLLILPVSADGRGQALFGWRTGQGPAPEAIGRLGLRAGTRERVRLEVVADHLRVVCNGTELGFVRLADGPAVLREQATDGLHLELLFAGTDVVVHRLALSRPQDANQVTASLLNLGGVLRMPTQAQWVRAAVGGGNRRYPWGDEWNTAFCNNWRAAGGVDATLRPGGSFPEDRSTFGVFDMAGNVQEWLTRADSRFPLRPVIGGNYGSGSTGIFSTNGEHGGYNASMRTPGTGFRVVMTLPHE